MNERRTASTRRQTTAPLKCAQIFILSLIIIFVSFCVNFYIEYHAAKDFEEVRNWLKRNNLSNFVNVLKENEFTSLKRVGQLSKVDIALALKHSWLDSPKSTTDDVAIIYEKVQYLKRTLQFRFWLSMKQLEELEAEFNKLNIYTLQDVIKYMTLLRSSPLFKRAGKLLIELEYDPDIIEKLPVTKSNSELFVALYYVWVWMVRIAKFVFIVMVSVTLISLVSILFLFNHLLRMLGQSFLQYLSNLFSQNHLSTGTNQRQNQYAHLFSRQNTLHYHNGSEVGFFTSLIGNYFDSKKTTVSWSSNSVVGTEAVVSIKFYKHNGLSYSASYFKTLTCEVTYNNILVPSSLRTCEELNAVTIHFTPIVASSYKVALLINSDLISYPAFKKKFNAGPIDAFKSSLVVTSSLLVFEASVQELIIFDERDKFGNPCTSRVEELYKYQFEIYEKKNNGEIINPLLSFNIDDVIEGSRNKAWITIKHAGVYSANVYYDHEILDEIVLMVLTAQEMIEVNKNIASSSWNLWYEAYIYAYSEGPLSNSQESVVNNQEMISTLNRRRHSVMIAPAIRSPSKKKKVYCFLTSKFVTIKEYYWKIIPRKLYTFRIKPSLKISLLFGNEDANKGFQLETTSGHTIQLHSLHRNVLVATFIKLLLKNIGGSEGFEDKRKYFYEELKKLHSNKSQNRAYITIKRAQIVKSTWASVKSFSQGDWWRKVDITFDGEQGLDYGGLTREWIHLLVRELFHTDGALFRRFNKDDPQGLIHPNPYRKSNYQKLKLFELAGLVVGKCLVECSCGAARQQFVKARFTRSFLSQLLGLHVSWKHFETDDKEYYRGKIKYILDNDPEYLDLTFTEDLYDNDNKLVETIELKQNGSKIDVKESNKLEYIQRLAEYRLYESVRDEISTFMKGLHFIIPEGLLSMFDENELELLVCGIDNISIGDFKSHCIEAGSSKSFKKVMTWFWTVISGFSQEELSRLLQFSTGCSQLPPSGFVGLVPLFQITHSGGLDILPTAHTCFNNLCLPNYSSVENLKKMILIAITEGSEGFGMV